MKKLWLIPILAFGLSCSEIPTEPYPPPDDGVILILDDALTYEGDVLSKRCKLTPEICAEQGGGLPQCWDVEEFGTCPGPDCQCSCRPVHPSCTY